MRDLRVPLLVLGFFGVAASVRLAAWPIAQIDLPRSSGADSNRPATSSARRIAAESVATIVSRDPFRIGRRPLLPPYDPLRLAEQATPLPPKPMLILVGVVDGVDPSAVIEGLPGVDGARVVRIGDVIAGLRIKTIADGRVLIAGMDTTWVLEVREPWKN